MGIWGRVGNLPPRPGFLPNRTGARTHDAGGRWRSAVGFSLRWPAPRAVVSAGREQNTRRAPGYDGELAQEDQRMYDKTSTPRRSIPNWPAPLLPNRSAGRPRRTDRRENHASPLVMEAQGSKLTNKYAEGYPASAITVAASMWMWPRRSIERVNSCSVPITLMQPHSGSQANQAVYFALLQPKTRSWHTATALPDHGAGMPRASCSTRFSMASTSRA